MVTEASPEFDPRAAATSHRWLLALAEETPGDDVQAVLNLGAAVLLHARLEPAHLHRVLRLVDPAVLTRLESDHDRLHEDLEFLWQMQRSDPGAKDLALLSAGLLQRVRDHLDRDERTLYRPLARLLDADGAANAEPAPDPDVSA